MPLGTHVIQKDANQFQNQIETKRSPTKLDPQQDAHASHLTFNLLQIQREQD